MKTRALKFARTCGITAVIALGLAGCSNPENRPDPQPAETTDSAESTADTAAETSASESTSSSASASESTSKSSTKSSGKSSGASSTKSSSSTSSSKEPTAAADLGYGETIEPSVMDGFYRIALPDGSLCELPEAVAPGEDGLRCLLNIDKPVKDVNGALTRGIVFRNGMFTPDEQLSTTEAAEAFMERNESAEELKGAQIATFADYSVVAESADEIGLVGANEGGFGTFFIAGQAISPFWNPTPAWVEVPTMQEYLERVISAEEKAGRR